MIIRKLTPADYHGMLVLYRELDQFHVDARPDFLCVKRMCFRRRLLRPT